MPDRHVMSCPRPLTRTMNDTCRLNIRLFGRQQREGDCNNSSSDEGLMRNLRVSKDPTSSFTGRPRVGSILPSPRRQNPAAFAAPASRGDYDAQCLQLKPTSASGVVCPRAVARWLSSSNYGHPAPAWIHATARTPRGQRRPLRLEE